MSAYKRNGIWYVEFIQNGVRVKRSAGRASSKAQAQSLERSLRHALEQAQPDRSHRTFDEALKRWLNGEAKAFRDPNFVYRVRRALPFIAGRGLDEAVDAAEELRNAALAEGLAPATINRSLAVIKRLCTLAFRWGWLAEPLGARIPFEKVRNARTVAPTREEVEALAAACSNSEAGRFVRAAAYSGLRKGELRRLHPGSFVVDNGVGWLVVTGTKNGEDRMVPVPADKHSLFDPLPFQLSRGQLERNWDRARKQLGLTHVHFHDLRHSFGTWLSGSGANAFQIATLMGHKDHRNTNRYVQRPAAHLIAATQKLSSTSLSAGDPASGSASGDS